MSTKQKILDAAIQVLIEDGFLALTQTRVAKAAGIGQGLLTYHFPTRSDLLTAVVDESKTQMSKPMAHTSHSEPTIDNFADLLITRSTHKPFLRLMLALTVAAIDDPSLHEWFEETDKNTRQKTRDLLLHFGYQVEDSALHVFRATVIGASLIHMQKNTKTSEQTLALIIKQAVKQLLDNAIRI